MHVADALFMARRHIDHAYAKKDGKLCLLALDLAKAFDGIMPHSMIHALRRFGIPEDFLNMINAIYSSRSFFVRDANIQIRIANPNVLGSVKDAHCHQCDLSWS